MASPLDILLRKQMALPSADPISPERAVTEIIAPGATLTDNPTTKRTELRLGSATSWTSFVPVLQTTNTNFVIGSGGNVNGRFRTLGNCRQIEISARWGGSPSIGTGDLLLPLAASSPPTIDTSQLIPLDAAASFVVAVQVYFFGGTAAEYAAGFPLVAIINAGKIAVPTTAVTANYSVTNGEATAFFFEVPVL